MKVRQTLTNHSIHYSKCIDPTDSKTESPFSLNSSSTSSRRVKNDSLCHKKKRSKYLCFYEKYQGSQILIDKILPTPFTLNSHLKQSHVTYFIFPARSFINNLFLKINTVALMLTQCFKIYEGSNLVPLILCFKKSM